MMPLEMSIAFSIALLVLIFGVLFGIHLIQRFWAWYDDAVWDEREEDRPEPDDFPGSK